MPEEHSAGAVVFRNDEGKRIFLLLHYEAGHWSFPKGHIEGGETPMMTTIRETREETGIHDLRFIDGFKERIFYVFNRDFQKVHKDVIFFLAETKTHTIRVSYEHVKYAWLDLDRALGQITFDNDKEVLKKAELYMKKLEKKEKEDEKP